MKSLPKLFFYIILLSVTVSCNTLYSVRVINIEIVEPGNVKIPANYKKIALRYNNCNVSYNPEYAVSLIGEETLRDSSNTDSIASELYYNSFYEDLKVQGFFDTIIELEPNDYSNIALTNKKLNKLLTQEEDSFFYSITKNADLAVSQINTLTKNIAVYKSKGAIKKKIDPKLGLYTDEELQQISDFTGADILLSLDFFATIDALTVNKRLLTSDQTIFVMGLWNFYDLKEKSLDYFYYRVDTITERLPYVPNQKRLKLLHSREPILIASELSGNNFSNFLIPHWIEVNRMYYYSGHTEIKKTEELIREGKWKEAAEIWKKYVDSPNKNIAAKCMFNMGLACEMEGNLDAAVDWVVRSFHVFEDKNQESYNNCIDYINILGLRKQDLRRIELQLTQGHKGD